MAKKRPQGHGGGAGDGRPKSDATASTTPYHRMHMWQFQAVRDVLFVAAVIGLMWLGYALRSVTIPLLVALLLAYLFEPLIQWLLSRPALSLTRLRTVTMLLIVVIGGALVVLAIVVPLAVGQTAKLVRNYNDGTLHAQIGRIGEHVPQFLRDDFDDLLHVLPSGSASDDLAKESVGTREAGGTEDDLRNGQPPSAGPSESDVRRIVAEELEKRNREQGYRGIAEQGIDVARLVLTRVVGFGLLMALIPFYFFFFSLWYPQVLSFFERLIPEKNRTRALELIVKMDRVIAGFVRGRIVIAIIVAVMLVVGWYLCGVPYAIVLGLIIGVFSVVPYLSGVGLPIAVVLLFFGQLSLEPDDRHLWLGWFGVILWPSVVFAIVQVVETYILTPKIAGKATNLDPVTVVVAVLAGGALLGVYGMLLSIPIAACLKILITDVLAPRVNEWLKGERPDPLPLDRGD